MQQDTLQFTNNNKCHINTIRIDTLIFTVQRYIFYCPYKLRYKCADQYAGNNINDTIRDKLNLSQSNSITFPRNFTAIK